MGCDIHGTVERLIGGKWVMVKTLAYEDYNSLIRSGVLDRNYERFSRLAGVRSYGDETDRDALGIPDDVSDGTQYHVDNWGCDGHSHSYMDIVEASKIWGDTERVELKDYEKDDLVAHYFGIHLKPLEEKLFRVVFWFDN